MAKEPKEPKKEVRRQPAFLTKMLGDLNCACIASQVSSSIQTKVQVGDPFLDWALGGGIALNRLNVLAGQSGSGKSFLCALLAAAIQRISGPDAYVIWLDTEYFLHDQPDRISRLAKLGIDLDRLIILSSNQPDVVFSRLDDLENEMKSGGIRVCCTITDSLGSLEDQHAAKKFAEGEIEDAANKFGGNAKLIGALVKKLTRMSAENKMTTLLVQHAIVQQGDGQSKGPPKYIVTGGSKLRLLSDLMILSETVERKDALLNQDNSSVEFSDKGVVAAGKTIRVKVLKSRFCMEGRVAEFKVNFDTCQIVRTEDSLVELAKLVGVLVHPVNPETGKENSLWWTFKGREKKYQGEKNVLLALQQDKSLFQEIVQECLNVKDVPQGYNPADVTIDVD